MEFIVILVLCILATSKVTVQGFFAKKNVTTLADGALAVCTQIFGKSEWSGENQSFVAWTYMLAAFFSMLLYLFLKAKGNGITFKIRPSVVLYSLSVGVILGIFQFLNTKAIATIDATLLFPAYNAGTLILSSLSSVLILKDQLTNMQKISLLTGAAAVALMNI